MNLVGRCVCLHLITHLPPPPSSHICDVKMPGHSFSQEWLTFRKTEAVKQMERERREAELGVLHSDE